MPPSLPYPAVAPPSSRPAAVPPPETILPDEAELTRGAERLAREMDLPPCPALLNKFNRAIEDENTDQRTLVELVASDPGIAATLIKTANSPTYGLPYPIVSLQQAFAVVGLRTAANLISRQLLAQAFPARPGSPMQRFWDESTRLTKLAAELAGRVPGITAEEAATFLVFRDCGMAALLGHADQYVPIWKSHSQGKVDEALARERLQYGTDHMHVGQAIAREWQLPPLLQQAIRHHHDLAPLTAAMNAADQPPLRLAAFGILTDQIAAIRQKPGATSDWETSGEIVRELFGIAENELAALAIPRRA